MNPTIQSVKKTGRALSIEHSLKMEGASPITSYIARFIPGAETTGGNIIIGYGKTKDEAIDSLTAGIKNQWNGEW